MPRDPAESSLAALARRALTGAALAVLHPDDADRAADVVIEAGLDRAAGLLQRLGLPIEIERKGQ